MADSTKLTPQTIANAVRSQFELSLVSNCCEKHPLLGFILARYGVPTREKGIRIPEDGILMDGGLVGPERKKIASNIWEPAIHLSLPSDDTKMMGWYDTTPEDSGSGATGVLSRIKRARFARADFATPIMVYIRDLRTIRNAYNRAIKTGNMAAAAKIASDVTDIATATSVEKMIVQTKKIDGQLWAISNDYPTDQDADIYDKLFSWHSMCGVDNTYGGIDRALPGNAGFRGNFVDTNLPADMDVLFDYMQYSNGTSGLNLNDKGIQPNLWVVGNVLFPIFKRQANARNLKVYEGDEIPNVPVYGQKQEAIRLNANTLIICDPNCPTKGRNGATKNAMLCLSTDRLSVYMPPDAQFSVKEFFDLSDLPGQQEALYSQLRTEPMVATREPWCHVWFDDVG